MPFLGRKWDQEGKQKLRAEGQGQRILIRTALAKVVPGSNRLDRKGLTPLSSQLNILTRAGNFSKVPVIS